MTDDAVFEQSIRQLDDLYRHPLVPARQAGLRRAAFLLDQIGNPHRCFRSVHVAGSSGKGSTTTMIGHVLQAAGFRTGYFRSPHLESYRERIRVDGGDIEPDAWVRCFNRVWPVVEAMRSGSLPNYDLGRPSLFEVLFALMALHFAETGVEWAAVEAGLGGRLDASNLLQSDVAVITNVSLEHTQVLGDRVVAIATEKAAIVKTGAHAVTAAQDPIALEVIERRASDEGAPLLRVGREVWVLVRSESIDSQDLSLRCDDHQLDLRLPLGGEFQAVNAATAYAACHALRVRDIAIDDDAIVQGLQSVRVPGRFELVSRDPMAIVDGAHNPAAASELRASLERLLPNRRKVFLFAAMADKDLEGIARHLGPLANYLIVTRVPGSDRTATTAALQAAFAPYVERITSVEATDPALELALADVDASSALIVTGSLYLVGQVRRTLLRAAVAP